ncbi:MAG: glycerate kinase, partial [Ornithinimicrobium sp.]
MTTANPPEATPTSVLIAPDKFKGSLTAADVCAAVSAGILRHVSVDIAVCPVADGGDGTIAAAIAAGYEAVPVTAAGPTGEPVQTHYARLGEIAVVEMADVSGLVNLPGGRLEPLIATSRGTGEVMAAAIDTGCTQIMLGIGGSASTDGGAGVLAALGARFLDADGAELAEGGAALASLASVDVSALEARMRGVSLTVACDVDNPLTGPRGAAAVYAPQKGASLEQVAQLDDALGHFADVIADQAGDDVRDAAGAGAAGGVGYAALALLNAELRPGIDLVFDLVGFAGHLETADFVITGEGSLDDQTLNGKAPAGVASAAVARGLPVVAVCGRTTLSPERLKEAGIDAAYALSDL